MSWRIESVLEPPSRTLDAWMAVEVPFDGPNKPWTLHLVGWRVGIQAMRRLSFLAR